MHHPCPPLQTPSPCPLGSSHTGLVVPPWISHIWFHVKAFKHTVPSAWNALPLRSLHGCLHLKSQFSAGYSVYTFASKQAAQLFLGITASSSPGVIKNLLWLYHLQITQGINQMRMLWSKQPGVCTQSYILMVFFFSLQVIFRALSPPYDMENPYSAKAQEQLKITNLRVQLLKQQFCPCQRNDLNAKPQHFTHYAIYDFIVKGSCFCNGHADQCVPVDGFRPVKAPGVFHVVCNTSSHQWKTNHKLPSALGMGSLSSLRAGVCLHSASCFFLCWFSSPTPYPSCKVPINLFFNLQF